MISLMMTLYESKHVAACIIDRIQLCFDWNRYQICGPGSSVGIATDYGLEVMGSNPGGDEIFRASRPALGSTQSPVKWVPSLSRG